MNGIVFTAHPLHSQQLQMHPGINGKRGRYQNEETGDQNLVFWH
jgi:hypothetical protein